MKNIIIIATLTLNETQSEGAFEALTVLHQATHQNDKGCLQYDLHKDSDKAHTYVFIETWESEALLDEHMKKAHFKAFQTALEGKIKRMTIQKLEKIL